MSVLKINSAVYASLNKGIDVTTICQNLVDTGNDDIPVDNNTFTDPDAGFKKYFTISYTDSQGISKFKGCIEGDILDLV